MTTTPRYVGESTTELIDFDLRDERGRAIGARITVRVDNMSLTWPSFEVPAFVVVGAQATRDGVDFGSSASWREVCLADAADIEALVRDEIARRVAAAKKRYTRLARARVGLPTAP